MHHELIVWHVQVLLPGAEAEEEGKAVPERDSPLAAAWGGPGLQVYESCCLSRRTVPL